MHNECNGRLRVHVVVVVVVVVAQIIVDCLIVWFGCEKWDESVDSEPSFRLSSSIAVDATCVCVTGE